jgi:hypothetical protein
VADRLVRLLAGALLAACAPQCEVGPHPAASQPQPIEPACGRDRVPVASSGLVVQTSFERSTRARTRITNRGGRTRIVAPQSISLCAGPCQGYWAGCEPRRSWDGSAARPAYAVTLAPGETLELDVDAALVEQASSCEKVALIAALDVDGSRACAELGSWIAVAR